MQARHRAMQSVVLCGELAGHIREWVNSGDDGKFKQDLLSDETRWLPTCASMDILEDSLEAIRYFLRNGLSRERGASRGSALIGGRYLRLYGVLQALSLNQDAIANLYKCLLKEQYNWSDDSAWNRVRRIRVCIAGHPHNARHEGPSFLSRPELGARGFSFHSYHKNRDLNAIDVDLDFEIDAYLKEAATVLKGMAARFPIKRLPIFGLVEDAAVR